jgi:PST family polysaccharide transporter
MVIPDELARSVLGSANYQAAFIVVAVSNLVIAPSALLLAVLNGRKDLRSVTIFGLVGVGLSLFVTITLTLTLDLFGALVAQAIAQALVGLALFGYFWRGQRLNALSFSRPTTAALKSLLQYALMSIVAALALPLALICIRNHIADALSWEDAGYWQGMWRISEVYMLAVTGALTTYLLPRFSELSSATDLRRELIGAFSFLVPSVAAMGALIYFFRHGIIRLLFDERFLAMADLFVFQLIGDVAKISTWILAYLLIARSMTTAYVILEVVFASGFTFLAFGFVDRFGLVGTTYAYAITYFVNFVVLAIIVAHHLAQLRKRAPPIDP